MGKRHQCERCGLLHTAPKSSNILITLALLAFQIPTIAFAAAAVDGWLAVAAWIVAALQLLSLLFILAGLSFVATRNLTGEVQR